MKCGIVRVRPIARSIEESEKVLNNRLRNDRNKRTMVILYNCRNDVMVFNRSTTNPPPSTVSIVRARRFGVIASKSWRTSMP